MGIYGKDSPKKLIKAVISNMRKTQPQTDAIIINGDFSAHGTSLKGHHSKDEVDDAWSKMKKLTNDSLNEIRDQFPNIPILPSVGNNDVVHHNRVPCHGSKF